MIRTKEFPTNSMISTQIMCTGGVNGNERKCINLASYNYLALTHLRENVVNTEEVIRKYGVSMCSSSSELGTCELHKELEKLTAEFLGTEDALICGTGFATNSFALESLLSKKSIAISDEKNHASLIAGLRLSKTSVIIFKHNDMQDLEEKLKVAVLKASKHPEAYDGKILIVTEGLYSMDGTILNLPEVLRLKKKYKAYLYIDDAHGVGTLGDQGRGIFDHHKCNVSDIDVLMGTYSKAYGSSGGYVAGSRNTINFLRKYSSITTDCCSLSPIMVQHSIAAVKYFMDQDNLLNGNELLQKLRANSRYLRSRLESLGLYIGGHKDSPIIPWILCTISKVSFVSRALMDHGVAVAGVAYPATPLFKARIRFTVNASHTKEQLDQVLTAIEKISQRYCLK